jgi:hypothetical protein
MFPPVDVILKNLIQCLQSAPLEQRSVKVDRNLLAAVINHMHAAALQVSKNSQNETVNY